MNFDAVGSMHANSKYGCDYGGTIFGYRSTFVHVWTPSPFDSFNLPVVSKDYFGRSLPSGSVKMDGATTSQMTNNYWATIALGSYTIDVRFVLCFLFKETS